MITPHIEKLQRRYNVGPFSCGQEDLNHFLVRFVHAKDENARRYYERFNFVPSPYDPLHLMMLLKDLRKALGDQLKSTKI